MTDFVTHRRLGDVCEKIGSGATPRGGKDAYHATGITLIRSQNVYNSGFDRSGLAYIDDTQARQLSNVDVFPDDVLLNITGESVCRVCRVPDDVLPARVNQHVLIIRADRSTLDPEYLRYSLLAPGAQARLHMLSTAGATRRALTKGMVEDFEIPTPTLLQQKAIARILSALDDKIELNRQMNVTLEATARAVFKSWFVDFDPVRAKIDRRQPHGMNAETAALFPDRFEHVDGELVPAGWNSEPIGNHIDLQRGKTYKSQLKNLPGPYLLGLASIARDGGFRSDKLKTYGGESPDKICVQPGDIYVSLKDVTQSGDLLGSVARFPESLVKGRLTQDTVRLVFRDTGYSPNLLYRSLLDPSYRAYCRSHATGTTNLGLARDDFLSYRVMVPSHALQSRFDDFVDRITDLAEGNNGESQTLAELRDTLLPKLLSGELSVPAAEELTEEVA